MSRLPFPGLLSEQERANFESVQFQPYDRLVFKEFSWLDKNGVFITDVQPRQIITGPILLRVDERFDGDDPYFRIVGNGEIRVAHSFVGSVGNPGVTTSLGIFNQITTEVQSLYYNVKAFSITGTNPTQGRGWFLFHIIDLNRI